MRGNTCQRVIPSGCGCRRSSTFAPTPTSSQTSRPTRTGIGFCTNAYFLFASQVAIAKFVDTFKEFPAVQKPNTFTVDDALRKMSEALSGAT